MTAKATSKVRGSALVDTRVVYCGDNLDQLAKVPDASIDLIYIDPPFNSNRNYEVFWYEKREMRSFDDRHGSTQVYIDFMRPRCEQLYRVLKPTGTLYYHCDWHACHYVKVMLDQIFGEQGFVNEIIWKRQSAHNDAKQGSKHLGRVHDTLLMYAKGPEYYFKHLYRPYDPEYVQKFYRYVESETGRRYQLGDLGAPGNDSPSKGNPHYEFLGVTRYWRYSKENMEKLYQEGRIVQTKAGTVPRLKRYLDEGKGVPLGSVWDDIGPVQGVSREHIPFPTQKPLRLLERIIEISSEPNDIILDAFCGCGTALEAAQNSGRQWIGIDVSPTACRVMAKRIRDNCGLSESEALWRINRGFVVRDLPWTEAQLRKLPAYEFENWAVIAVNGTPNRKHVADMGIDGRIYPLSALPKSRAREDQFAFMDEWYPIQVKQTDKIGRPDVDAFETAMLRENRTKGFMVGFDFTQDAEREIRRFKAKAGRTIEMRRVKDMLEDADVIRRIPPSPAKASTGQLKRSTTA
jgi:DNA modification methylase